MPHSESVFPLGVPIAPTEPTDVNPTHIAEYGRGGLMSVADTTARDAIPLERKTVGMLVYVQSSSTYYRLSALPDTWAVLSTGGSFNPTDVQSLYKTARNASNVNTIPKGAVVYVSGSHASTELLVDLADADTEPTSSETIGVAYAAIAPNTSGLILTFGYLSGITTGSLTGSEGTPIYLSSTPGEFQSEVPVAPKHGLRVGFLVKKAGGGAGSIFVNIQNYQELKELSDVYIPTTPSNNDTLVYDATDARWENRKLALASLDSMNHTKLLGRRASVAGTPEEITVGSGLKLSTTGTLAADTIALGTGTANSSTFLRGDGTWAIPPGGGTLTVNTQDFTASGTWTKPANALWVEVTMCGAGQNGNDGGVGFSGYGGAAGRYAERRFLAADLPSTVSVTCGEHQSGASVLLISSFGAYLHASGACGGPNDNNAGISSEYSGYMPQYSLFGCAANGDNMSDRNGSVGFAGGGGGAGGNSAGGDGLPAQTSGGAGGKAGSGSYDSTNPSQVATGGGGAGGAGGTTGANGSAGGYDLVTGFGNGGGGGGEGTSGAGGNGGAAVRGGGGGGGGKCASGTSAGGAGGDGFVRVRTLCFG